MKKIITGIAAVAMAASLFAVDFSASVQVKGDIAYGQAAENSSSFNLLGIENTNQKDADLLEVHFSGDKAGADFKFWTTAKEGALTVRALKVWFQPIDAIKISVGNNDLGLYTERLNWWKVPTGASVSEFGSWDGRWASGAGVHENFGSTIEITPIDGLYIAAGAGSDVVSKETDQDVKVAQWGAVAKYTFSDLGLSIGAAYRDTSTFKLITVGADFAKDSFYGFLQAKLRLDSDANAYSFNKDNVKLAGITIDNYLSYNFGFMNLQATLPVTIRGLLPYNTDAEKKADPSYMTARIKASFPIDAITAYVVVGSDEGLNNGPASSGGNTVWTLDENFGSGFNFYVNPGVSFNVGACALDIGVEFAIDNRKIGDDTKTNVYWAVPFTTKVSF